MNSYICRNRSSGIVSAFLRRDERFFFGYGTFFVNWKIVYLHGEVLCRNNSETAEVYNIIKWSFYPYLSLSYFRSLTSSKT